MTRIRSAHNYHESKLSQETICKKCGETAPKVCEWCGSCLKCHNGMTKERDF